jgi:hypothetical protein
MGAFGFSIFGYDLWGLLDASLFGIIACGIWRRSRIAAVAGFTIFAASRPYIWVQSKTSTLGVVVALAIGFLLFHGVRGTFAYHKFRPQVPDFDESAGVTRSPPRPERYFRRITWIVSLVLAGLSLLGVVVSLADWLLSGEMNLEDALIFAALAGASLLLPWALFFLGRWIVRTFTDSGKSKLAAGDDLR